MSLVAKLDRNKKYRDEILPDVYGAAENNEDWDELKDRIDPDFIDDAKKDYDRLIRVKFVDMDPADTAGEEVINMGSDMIDLAKAAGSKAKAIIFDDEDIELDDIKEMGEDVVAGMIDEPMRTLGNPHRIKSEPVATVMSVVPGVAGAAKVIGKLAKAAKAGVAARAVAKAAVKETKDLDFDVDVDERSAQDLIKEYAEDSKAGDVLDDVGDDGEFIMVEESSGAAKSSDFLRSLGGADKHIVEQAKKAVEKLNSGDFKGSNRIYNDMDSQRNALMKYVDGAAGKLQKQLSELEDEIRQAKGRGVHADDSAVKNAEKLRSELDAMEEAQRGIQDALAPLDDEFSGSVRDQIMRDAKKEADNMQSLPDDLGENKLAKSEKKYAYDIDEEELDDDMLRAILKMKR